MPSDFVDCVYLNLVHFLRQVYTCNKINLPFLRLHLQFILKLILLPWFDIKMLQHNKNSIERKYIRFPNNF